MLITLSYRTVICQSDAEVYLTGVAPLRAVSYKLHFFLIAMELAIFKIYLVKAESISFVL